MNCESRRSTLPKFQTLRCAFPKPVQPYTWSFYTGNLSSSKCNGLPGLGTKTGARVTSPSGTAQYLKGLSPLRAIYCLPLQLALHSYPPDQLFILTGLSSLYYARPCSHASSVSRFLRRSPRLCGSFPVGNLPYTSPP
jgi:hypothetical protein